MDPDIQRFRAAAAAARKSEHHFPADCLVEAALTVESLRARLAAIEGLAINAEATCTRTGDRAEDYCEGQGCAWYAVDRDAVLRVVHGVKP